MTTILQAVKQIVTFTPEDELKDTGYKDANLYKIYMSEYGNYNGFNQKAVTEYCQGLPNIANFPFMNNEIIDAMYCAGVERKTEKGRDNLIYQYWQTVGYVVFKALEKEKKIAG